MKRSEKDNDPLVPNKKSEARTGCFPRSLILMVGVLSVLMSMMVLLASLYMLVSQMARQVVKKSCQDWLEKNHWDVKVRKLNTEISSFIIFQVTRVVWKVFAWIDIYHMIILSGVIGCTLVHNLFSL
jgi:hypothetical protein